VQVDELLALGRHAAQDLRSRYPGAPTSPAMFLVGHSMGGLMAALACLRSQRPWEGLMLCSPALGVKMGLKLRWAWTEVGVSASEGESSACLKPWLRGAATG